VVFGVEGESARRDSLGRHQPQQQGLRLLWALWMIWAAAGSHFGSAGPCLRVTLCWRPLMLRRRSARCESGEPSAWYIGEKAFSKAASCRARLQQLSSFLSAGPRAPHPRPPSVSRGRAGQGECRFRISASHARAIGFLRSVSSLFEGTCADRGRGRCHLRLCGR